MLNGLPEFLNAKVVSLGFRKSLSYFSLPSFLGSIFFGVVSSVLFGTQYSPSPKILYSKTLPG